MKELFQLKVISCKDQNNKEKQEASIVGVLVGYEMYFESMELVEAAIEIINKSLKKGITITWEKNIINVLEKQNVYEEILLTFPGTLIMDIKKFTQLQNQNKYLSDLS